MIDINLIRDNSTRELVVESEKKRFKDPKKVLEIYIKDQERIKLGFELDLNNKTKNLYQKQIRDAYKSSKGPKGDTNVDKKVDTKGDTTGDRKGDTKDPKVDRKDPKVDIKDNFKNLSLIPSTSHTPLTCPTSPTPSTSHTPLPLLIQKFKKAEKDSESLQNKLKVLDEEINSLLKGIGNLVDKRVVVSRDENQNEIISTFRSPRALYKTPKPYSSLMSNFTYSNSGSKIVGHRGYFLSGKMAKLGRALSLYAVDFLEEKGYLFIQTPVMMKKDVMARTSQLSDFDDQLYKVEDDLYLIATSEQPLSALHLDERLTDLPKFYAGQSLCFRKEAGAHGKDNAGLFRVHQFEKIEQFIICKPDESDLFHSKMIKISEEFYKSLDISYNVVSIVSGELNDAASIKYDLEAYFPSFDKYRELVSCSNCTDYQSRELEIRYGLTKENNKKVYVHMLNGTLCAVQRTLCCIVENYQEEGRVVVPEVLRKYCGFDYIEY